LPAPCGPAAPGLATPEPQPFLPIITRKLPRLIRTGVICLRLTTLTILSLSLPAHRGFPSCSFNLLILSGFYPEQSGAFDEKSIILKSVPGITHLFFKVFPDDFRILKQGKISF
jgi:hypothetical protein